MPMNAGMGLTSGARQLDLDNFQTRELNLTPNERRTTATMMPIVLVRPTTVGEQQQRPVTILLMILTSALLLSGEVFALYSHDASVDSHGNSGRRAGTSLHALPTLPSLALPLSPPDKHTVTALA